MCQPEIGPRAKAMAIRESPKAKATPALPTWLPASTAVPKPANTNTNVPNNSVAYFISAPLPKLDLARRHSTRDSQFLGFQLFEFARKRGLNIWNLKIENTKKARNQGHHGAAH